MLSVETKRTLQQVSQRIQNSALLSSDLGNQPDVVSEVSSSVDVIANKLFRNDQLTDSKIVIGGKSAPITLALLSIGLARVGLPNTKIITLESGDNKRMYEGETYDPDIAGERNYIAPRSIIDLSRTTTIRYFDDRVRTGEKAYHVRKALLSFGFPNVDFLAFASSIKNPDVISGTDNTQVYSLLDNLSYLFSRRALLLAEGKIVHRGSYHEVDLEDVPTQVLDALNSADHILSTLKNNVEEVS